MVTHWTRSSTYSTPGPVNTWMGDCLTAGRYTVSVFNQPPAQLSLPSLRGRLTEYQLFWLGLRQSAFACVLCRVAGKHYVIPYGWWHAVTLSWVYYTLFNLLSWLHMWSENPTLEPNIMSLCCIQPELCKFKYMYLKSENNGSCPPSSSRSSSIIDFGANRKPICNFLLVISSNFRHISCRFRDIDP